MDEYPPSGQHCPTLLHRPSRRPLPFASSACARSTSALGETGTDRCGIRDGSCRFLGNAKPACNSISNDSPIPPHLRAGTVSEFEHWGQNSSISTGVLNDAPRLHDDVPLERAREAQTRSIRQDVFLNPNPAHCPTTLYSFSFPIRPSLFSGSVFCHSLALLRA